MNGLPACMAVCPMNAQCLQRPEEGLGSPGAAVWVPGIKPGSSGSIASTFNHRITIGPAPVDKFRNVKSHSSCLKTRAHA